MTTAARGPGPPDKRVRVVVVDDAAEIRTLLRALLDQDDRFEVVGEGADGIEAVELAASLAPDLLILDRHMPRLGGLETLPEIARFAPRTNVILFTATASSGTYHAAISAGALDVLEKSVEVDFVDRLAETLVDHWASEDAEVQMHIGPVSSESARLWIGSSRRIVSALRLHPEVMTEAPPTEILDLFGRFLQIWDEFSEGRDEFFWAARARFSDVQKLVEWWARVDDMSEEQITALGVEWSAPEARPFYHALTEGVLNALDAHAASQELARALRRQWTPEV